MFRFIIVLSWLLFSSIVYAAPNCLVPKEVDGSGKSPALAKAAQALRDSDPCKVRVRVKSLAQIWRMLLLDKSTMGRRLEAPPPAGLPTGNVFPEQDVIQVDLSDAIAEGIQSFSISVDGRPLFNYNPPARQIALPVGEFNGNSRFTCVLRTKEKGYQFEFRLLDDENKKKVGEVLSELDAEPLDEVTKLFFKAAIFNSYDLLFDRDRIISDLRKRLN